MRHPMVIPPTLYEDTENLLRLFDDLHSDNAARCGEINARVDCYAFRRRYRPGIEPEARYTHDRAALRGMQPDDWRFETSGAKGKFICIARAEWRTAELRSYEFPTPTLARLHAIVLAMACMATWDLRLADEIELDGRIAQYFR